jgi:hypothetical protein
MTVIGEICMEYNYISENAKSVSMHDCVTSGIETWNFSGNNISFTLKDGFAVFPDNEMNTTGRIMQTGESEVCLIGVNYKGARIPYSKPYNDKKVLIKEERPAEIDPYRYAGQQYTILGHEYNANTKLFNMDIFIRFPSGINLTLYFGCEKVLFCWNEFTGDSFQQRHIDYCKEHGIQH